MYRLLLMAIVLLLPPHASADEPPRPPAVWETCSPNGNYCATLDPVSNSVTVYRAGMARDPLWTVAGWSRVAALADDGEHLVLGYHGMNLIPLDYDYGMPMLTFHRRSQVIRVVRLGDLVGWLNLQRTVSHYYWGDYLGLDADGYYVVKVSRGREIRFDMTTGMPAR